MLKKVKIINREENKSPKFIKTKLLTCQRGSDAKPFHWEVANTHDSVHILINNTESRKLTFVSQVRIPVLNNDSSNDGIVVEACAGLIDKNKSIIKIAQEEILEECGYNCPTENIKFIKTLKNSVGSSGSKLHTYIAYVNNDMKINKGGGLDDEDIEVIDIRYKDVYKFFYDSEIDTDAITMFLVSHWLYL